MSSSKVRFICFRVRLRSGNEQTQLKYVVPFRFQGLYALGCVFMFINFGFFMMNCTLMGLRFFWYPPTFKKAFFHPTESLFIPTFVLSIAQILINITEYGLDIKVASIQVIPIIKIEGQPSAGE